MFVHKSNKKVATTFCLDPSILNNHIEQIFDHAFTVVSNELRLYISNINWWTVIWYNKEL